MTRAKRLVFFLAGIASGVLISPALVQRFGLLLPILASLVVLALIIALSVGTTNRDATKDL